jgi:hypothetical protein
MDRQIAPPNDLAGELTVGQEASEVAEISYHKVFSL